MPNPYETLIVEGEEGGATVYLNRPDLHNALNEAMIEELTQVFAKLSQDSSIRLILLTGNGESFCAGADLNWMKKISGATKAQSIADSKKLHQMLMSIYQCQKPVLVRVNGPAIGGGVGLVAAADIAFAENDAIFSFSEVKLGLIPAVISPFVVRKIGENNAREFFLTAERFGPHKAQEMGLVNYCAIPDQLTEKIEEKIKHIKAAAPGALADCKKLIQKIRTYDLDELGDITAEMITERRQSEEGQEGMVAFLTKRKPNWIL